jgi:hypothetical protein
MKMYFNDEKTDMILIYDKCNKNASAVVRLCPLLLIKVDFDWDFALNKYSLRAYLQSFPTTYNT